ncbi:uncharacterized protein [Salminus brasiliensis]|uniref:uncharacterized protein isoform X2 n=1 Tax=Salminus brasiliensis TaxID=930266 RepID=UPI003B836E75
MYTLLLLFYLGGTTLQLVKCFSDGNLDETPDVCNTMAPDHGTFRNLDFFTIAPHCFIVAQSGLSGTVTLRRQRSYFSGFMLEARDINDNVPLGEFSLLNPEISRLQTCHGSPSAVTQINNQDKNEVSVKWTAPAPGQYYFVATFVQDLGSWFRTSLNLSADCETLINIAATSASQQTTVTTTLVPTSATTCVKTESITSTATTVTSTSTSAPNQTSVSTTITEVITSLVTSLATSTAFTTSPDNTTAKATTPVSIATSDLTTGLTTSTVSTTRTVSSTVDNGNSSSTFGNTYTTTSLLASASTKQTENTTVSGTIISFVPTSTPDPTKNITSTYSTVDEGSTTSISVNVSATPTSTPNASASVTPTFASTQVSTARQNCTYSKFGTDCILVLLLLSYLFLAEVFLLLVKHRKRKCLVAMKVCSILSVVLSTVAFILLLVFTKLVVAQVLTGLAVLLNLLQIIMIFLFRGPSHELRRHFCWAFGLFAFVNFCLISAAIFVGLWFFKNQCLWLLIVMAVYLACDLLFFLYFSNFACKALEPLHRKMTLGSCYLVSLIIIILLNVAFTIALIAGIFVCPQSCSAFYPENG